MATAEQPVWISTPIPISTDFVIPVHLFADRPPATPLPLTGRTVKVYILNPGVTDVSAAKEYSVTAVSAAAGHGTITLTGTSHTVLGTANVQVHVDGLLRARYQWEFVEKYS